MTFVARSDVGRQRDINEDAVTYSSPGSFGILADGMGGYEAGEVASRLAVEILERHLEGSLPRVHGDEDRLFSMLPDLVTGWVDEVNRRIRREGRDRSKMGTTCVLLYVGAERGLVAHVGDSRIYLVREGAIERLTEDHAIATADIPPEKRPEHLTKSKYLTRSLGTRPEVEPDVRTVDVRADDTFVLCSDGLTDCVRDDEIRRVVLEAGPDLEVAAETLVAVANRRGGPDNITVLLGRLAGSREEVSRA